MKTYEINQLDGRSFKANNVIDIWDSEHGVTFQGEGNKTIAFIPFKNLANYHLVVEKPVTSTVTTAVGESTVTIEQSGQIKVKGAVTINQNLNLRDDETIEVTERLISKSADDRKGRY